MVEVWDPLEVLGVMAHYDVLVSSHLDGCQGGTAVALKNVVVVAPCCLEEGPADHRKTPCVEVAAARVLYTGYAVESVVHSFLH